MDIIFSSPALPFSEVSGTNRLFRKELIYEGRFVKNGKSFEIRREDFDRWLSNYQKFRENGLQVFLQLEHDDNPEKTRGELHNLEVAKNEDGLNALYGYFDFRDEEAEKLAQKAQVSIWFTSEFVDGKGNEYKGGVLRHVALTQHPVVPGLGKFQSLAASLVEGKFMLKQLAQKLKIDGSDSVEEEKAEELILSYVGKIQKSLAEIRGKEKEKEKESSKKKEEPPKKKVQEKKLSKDDPILKRLIASEKKTRKLQLSNLVEQGRITKAVSDQLAKTFCEEGVALSLDSSGEFSDSFDATIEALSKNEQVLSFKEKSGPQAGNEENNPLLKDAEARAKA